MVFFNYATMQMAAKIVYYGPGLCGKTTNLHVIYSRTAPNSRGEMVSLETETDRTLFFDLLPLDVGVIGGFKTRLQLYTVPGQVFYNTTRKLVLKGVDGIVFVADSQRPMLDSNRESWKNLRENLLEIGLKIDEIPRVLQYNKRDLANILTLDELNAALNPDRVLEFYESSATNGVGVFETLKAISKLTLKSLRSKMTGETKRPAVVATAASSASIPAAPREAPAAAGRPRAPREEPRPAAPPRPAPPPPAASAPTAVVPAVAPAPPAPAAPPAAEPPAVAAPPARSKPRPAVSGTMQKLDLFSASVKKGGGAAATPPPSPALAPEPPRAERAPEPAPEVHFAEDPDAPVTAEPIESTVKHVRVRSSVDILSELDKLRKLATQRPTGQTGIMPALPKGSSPDAGRGKAGSGMSIDDLLSNRLNHKKDVSRSFDVGVPRDALARSRQVTIALRFTDGHGAALVPDRTFDLDLANLQDVQRLLLSLKINVQSE